MPPATSSDSRAPETRPARPRVIVVIPAHNEVDQLGRTIEAVLGQSRRPDEVFICTDNAPPELAGVAARYPVAVTSTVGNSHRKAGNLNANLAPLLAMPEEHGGLRDTDIIMGFDADSVPDRHFIASALRWIGRGYGAVGATFHGRPGGGVLGLLQRSEFARFARHQARKPRCDVLSGTGWAITVAALRLVASTRHSGQVYDHLSPVEDYELTLKLRSLGVRSVAPRDCLVLTDVMETWRDWTTQRLRWQYGTLIELVHYGWSPHTREMITRQVLTYLLALATPLTVAYLAWSYLLFGWRGVNPLNAPLYLAGIAIVVLEQAWQARGSGWRGVVATLLVIPDFGYSVARQLVYARALYRVATRRGHVQWGAGTSI
jgi:poly-beta-1,6-N-acetyl-D-glucosamine synthase